MSVHENSIIAYHEDRERLTTIRAQVYYVVCNATHPSSADIARILNVQRTTITGRLRELEEDGLIYKASVKKDPFSHKTVSWYARTDKEYCEARE